ncbi:hypothetical protein BG015_001905 [Linnemannia schmuckeri]|uniref:Uncharacterized protein n=1 Tax=Linnemannia schmuckeri TaxID=64567 RepID=A0A9P5VDM4_9FUNG|nr:hypothetical protein BG015_001905 [Linnemannia schmuckeri]
MSHPQVPENSLDDIFGLDFVVCVVSPSMGSVPRTTQLLLCPVCTQPFKSRLRRKVEDAALVLSMLYQAV